MFAKEAYKKAMPIAYKEYKTAIYYALSEIETAVSKGLFRVDVNLRGLVEEHGIYSVVRYLGFLGYSIDLNGYELGVRW